LSLGGTATSNKNGYWTLGKQKNRDTGHKTYASLRIYVPTNNDTKPLLEKLLVESGEDCKLYFKAKTKIQCTKGIRIILDQIQPEPEQSTPSRSLAERADQIITIIALKGGESAWPLVCQELGLKPGSMPGPILVKALEERGMQRTKDPRTSTMIWKLVDREKLNGWT
jgi:hypothetical protein